MASVAELFSSNKVSVLGRPAKLHTVQDSDLCSHVLAELDSKQIRSLPVLSAGKCVGLIDRIDLVSSFISNIKGDASAASIAAAIKQTFATPASKVMNCSKHNPLVVLDQSTLLEDVLKEQSLELHRAVIADDAGTIVQIVSQSDVVSWVNAAQGKSNVLGEKASMTLSQLNLGGSSVVSIAESTLAVDAFRRLESESVSSLAVVDASGRLVGYFSGSDLRQVSEAAAADFLKPIKDFQAARGRGQNVVKVKPNDSFQSLVAAVSNAGHHRAYTIDDAGKALGVITLTDIVFEMQVAMRRRRAEVGESMSPRNLHRRSSNPGRKKTPVKK